GLRRAGRRLAAGVGPAAARAGPGRRACGDAPAAEMSGSLFPASASGRRPSGRSCCMPFSEGREKGRGKRREKGEGGRVEIGAWVEPGRVPKDTNGGGSRMTTKSLSRVALVTGGSRGIGRAIVRRLSGDGVRVLNLDLQAPEALEPG